MVAPTTQDLLAAWEAALGAPPHERPIRVLAPLLAASAAPGDTLSLGERDRLLLELRERAFGSRVEGLASCPECGETLEVGFELDDVRTPRTASAELTVEPGPSAAVAPFTVDHGGYRIGVRPILHRDLAAVAVECPDEEAARRGLLERCVVEASRGGRPVAVHELPADVETAVVEALREADPQAHVRLALRCPACHADWVAPFDIGAFLWAELDAWSRRTLDAVHRLASAYGWSEAEILALAPARRRHYLERIGA